MNAPARIPEPAANVDRTAARPTLSASAATAAIPVVIASAKNQNPTSGLWYHGVGWATTCVPTRMLRIRYAIQNDPHVPCASVAIASRALYAHIPAMNCASPPNIAANGASASGDFGVPHQPARFDATMKVAPANPARPRIEGAAIGCRTTRVPNPFDDSFTPAEADARRSSSVLILASLQRITIYRACDSRAPAGQTYASAYDLPSCFLRSNSSSWTPRT